ncbi:DUF1343 domain-containing protein [Bacteriovoracaceae bacterium]|nr:DUF1343 domain-containing protein [Bacteriovoracaceae bacterium]
MKFWIGLVLIFAANCYSVTNGIERYDDYKRLLEGKRLGFIVNQSSRIRGSHSIDFLLKKGMRIETLFALEHGLRGEAEAGEEIKNGKDVQTGISVVSLYGKKKAPSKEDLSEIDMILFDVQDLGVRFYTFISSLKRVLSQAVKYNKDIVVFDRPNPFLNIISGPVLHDEYRSFVGDIKLPITYGLSIGELAYYILHVELKAHDFNKLKVIKFQNFNRRDEFQMPKVFPSPNIRSQQAMHLYPTLALFEPTKISIGRGTYNPFTFVCAGFRAFGQDLFYPKSIKGLSANPKYKDQTCHGENLNDVLVKGFNLSLFKKYFLKWSQYERASIFNSKKFFTLLSGNSYFNQLVKNKFKNEKALSLMMDKERESFFKVRKDFLLY